MRFTLSWTMMTQYNERMVERTKRRRTRDLTIDYLRAVSIVVMIMMHVSPLYPQDRIATSIWIWGQWVVPAFILCSVAVDTAEITDARSYLGYLWRRIIRLMPPYYLWLVAYLVLEAVIGSRPITLQAVAQNLTLTGGYDFNWLIVLFLAVTAALPFLRTIAQRSELQSLITLLVCLTTSAVYMGSRGYWYGGYRYFMIIPWWGVTLAVLLIIRWVRSKDWISMATLVLVHLGIFSYWYRYLSAEGMSTHTFAHKYPPDIYFASFAVWSVAVVYIVMKLVTPAIKKMYALSAVLTAISRRSYAIFFVHILVLYIFRASPLRRGFGYLPFTLVLFAGTALSMALLVQAQDTGFLSRVMRTVGGKYRSITTRK